jgi:dTDP-4-dehydrorhamnose reductase
MALLWAVIGNTGLLGFDLQKTLLLSGEKVVGFNRTNLELELSEAEIAAQIFSLASRDFGAPPTILVNAVAYTAVDKAESDLHELEKVNVDYARKLAKVARSLGASLIHVSTDFVFDGSSKERYEITDTPNPFSAYGKSKLSGEIAVQESGADYQIFRTAWIYGENGNCFPKTVARVLREKGVMNVVGDQIGQPTWSKDLAELIIAHNDVDSKYRPRIVHGTASGSSSWYEFAREVAESLGYDPEKVVFPITTAEYPTAAKRPSYSVLNNQNATGLVIDDWRRRWREAAPLVLSEDVK